MGFRLRRFRLGNGCRCRQAADREYRKEERWSIHFNPSQQFQVFWYSGPSPPSGVVKRPPLAVMAPHWMQLV